MRTSPTALVAAGRVGGWKWEAYLDLTTNTFSYQKENNKNTTKNNITSYRHDGMMICPD